MVFEKKDVLRKPYKRRLYPQFCHTKRCGKSYLVTGVWKHPIFVQKLDFAAYKRLPHSVPGSVLIRKGDNLRCEKRRLGVQTVHSKKYWKNNESCTTKVSWIGSFHVNHDFPVRFVCHVHPVCHVCPELGFVATVTTGCCVKFVPTV